MTVRDAIEQAYRNGYEAGVKSVAYNLSPTAVREAKLYWKPVSKTSWNLTCSACDSHLGCRENSNFCPECGAKFVYPKAVAPWSPEGE